MAICDVVGFWKAMSGLPSPSKSPVPTAFQGDGGASDSTVVPVLVTPEYVHTERRPLALSWRSMSGLPSPLKSATPDACQLDGGACASRVPPLTLPFALRYHTARRPDDS